MPLCYPQYWSIQRVGSICTQSDTNNTPAQILYSENPYAAPTAFQPYYTYTLFIHCSSLANMPGLPVSRAHIHLSPTCAATAGQGGWLLCRQLPNLLLQVHVYTPWSVHGLVGTNMHVHVCSWMVLYVGTMILPMWRWRRWSYWLSCAM